MKGENLLKELPSSWLSYTDAIGYCESMTRNGYSDWIMPDFSQLQAVCESKEDISSWPCQATYPGNGYWATPAVESGVWCSSCGNRNATNPASVASLRCVREYEL